MLQFYNPTFECHQLLVIKKIRRKKWDEFFLFYHPRSVSREAYPNKSIISRAPLTSLPELFNNNNNNLILLSIDHMTLLNSIKTQILGNIISLLIYQPIPTHLCSSLKSRTRQNGNLNILPNDGDMDNSSQNFPYKSLCCWVTLTNDTIKAVSERPKCWWYILCT